MENAFRHALHLSRQTARLAYYAGHGRLTQRIAKRHPDAVRRGADVAIDRAAFRKALGDLIRDDLAQVAAGTYPAPPAFPGGPVRLLRDMIGYYRDLPETLARRARGDAHEIAIVRNGGYPRYYLQNFHYQSGGWLSDRSAALYDHQVETLFGGAADMMRRQGLPPLVARLRSRRRPRPRLLDIGTGTGAFLRAAATALPHLRLHGLEPSPHYRAAAARSLPRARLMGGFIEAIAEQDARFDAASAVFLFHELPPKIRLLGLSEVSRILRPGGIFVLVDALQHGDVLALDPLLDLFPGRFHEPYFSSWLDCDIKGLAAAAGLRCVETRLAFLAKVLVFEKPAGDDGTGSAAQ